MPLFQVSRDACGATNMRPLWDSICLGFWRGVLLCRNFLNALTVFEIFDNLVCSLDIPDECFVSIVQIAANDELCFDTTLFELEGDRE